MFALGGSGHDGPQLICPGHRLFERSIAVDDDIRDGKPVSVRRLRTDPPESVVTRVSTQLDHPLDAGIDARMNHHDEIELISPRAFGEQWDVVDDNGSGVCTASSSELFLRCGVDGRMDDPVKDGSLRGIAEDDRTQCRAIEGPVGEDNIVSELGGDGSQTRCARLDHIAGDLIGVHDDRAKVTKPARDDRFSGCDSTGEPYQIHAPMLAATD